MHMRVSCPPTRWPCYYGIDTPTRSELIASTHELEEVRQYITSDSLAYLSLDRMVSAVTRARTPSAVVPAAIGTARASADVEAAMRHSLPLAPDESRQHDEQGQFCHACWSGDYPVPLSPPVSPRQMRLLDV